MPPPVVPVLEKLKLFPVRQVEPVTVNPQVGPVEAATLIACETIQPFASVTVTVNVPAQSDEISCVVGPLDQI